MRLGALLLIPAALTAQSPLPWDSALELPWETALPGPPPSPLVQEESEDPVAQIQVTLTGDGSLRISNAQGRVTLRLGLSGRPLRLLRDAGTPLTLADFPCSFPAETPLTRGLGNLPLVGDDFRKALKGLLWILDDGERRVTLVHPATQQVIYLPLPAGQNWDLYLHPDRMEIQERLTEGEEFRETACWSLSWFILLPQFVKLSLPPSTGNPGTAFRPFPTK